MHKVYKMYSILILISIPLQQKRQSSICMCVFEEAVKPWTRWPYLPPSPPRWGLRHSCMCFLCVYVCVCVRASVCAQTRRSAEVCLVMALLCLVRTAATVTFTNAMNQRHGGQASRPKNNQLYSRQIDTGWTGRSERDEDTLNTPQGRINRREWGHRLTEGLLHWYSDSEGQYESTSDLKHKLKKRVNIFKITLSHKWPFFVTQYLIHSQSLFLQKSSATQEIINFMLVSLLCFFRATHSGRRVWVWQESFKS